MCCCPGLVAIQSTPLLPNKPSWASFQFSHGWLHTRLRFSRTKHFARRLLRVVHVTDTFFASVVIITSDTSSEWLCTWRTASVIVAVTVVKDGTVRSLIPCALLRHDGSLLSLEGPQRVHQSATAATAQGEVCECYEASCLFESLSSHWWWRRGTCASCPKALCVGGHNARNIASVDVNEFSVGQWV